MAISRVGVIGVASASLSFADLPAGCLPGDVAVVTVSTDGSSTIPTIPGTWTAVGAGGGSGGDAIAYRGARRILTAADIASGGWTFTGANAITGAVYRGMDQTTPIGTIVGGSGGSGSVSWPAIAVTAGSSWVMLNAHTKTFNIGPATNTTGGDGPTTYNASVRNHEAASRDSGGPCPDASWAQTFLFANSPWQSHGYELKAAAVTNNLPGGPITLDLGVLAGELTQPTPIDLTATPLVVDLGVLAGVVEQPIDLAPSPVVVDLAVAASAVQAVFNLTAGPVALDLGVPDPRVAYNEPPPKFIQGAPAFEEWDEAGDEPPLKYQSG